MISEKQLTANRRDTSLSRGPASAAGRRRRELNKFPPRPQRNPSQFCESLNSPWQKCENTSAVDGGGKNERK
jgi:hypothetical protein